MIMLRQKCILFYNVFYIVTFSLGQIPVFTNLDDTVAVSNSEVAGTVLFTLTISDGDAEDDSTQLTLANTVNTGSASTLFEYDSLTCTSIMYKV